jgi:hypothetical protein
MMAFFRKMEASSARKTLKMAVFAGFSISDDAR